MAREERRGLQKSVREENKTGATDERSHSRRTVVVPPTAKSTSLKRDKETQKTWRLGRSS